MKKKDESMYEKELRMGNAKKRREKIKRTILFSIFGIAVLMALLLMLVSSLYTRTKEVTYPESTLSETRQKEVITKASADLPNVMEFSSFYLCIPDKEIALLSDSMLCMEDGIYTYTFYREKGMESTFLSHLIGGKYPIGGGVEVKVSDEGYINTLDATYFCGKTEKYYFVGYELLKDGEILQILITAKNANTLLSAKNTLDDIVGTLVEIPSEDKASGEGITESKEVSLEPKEEPVIEPEISALPFSENYPNLLPGLMIECRNLYDAAFGGSIGKLTHIATGDGEYAYYTVTLYFTENAEGFDACYLINDSSCLESAYTVDKESKRVITYVFRVPNTNPGDTYYYLLCMKDEEHVIEKFYISLQSEKACKYSPKYEETFYETDGVQKEVGVLEESD